MRIKKVVTGAVTRLKAAENTVPTEPDRFIAGHQDKLYIGYRITGDNHEIKDIQITEEADLEEGP